MNSRIKAKHRFPLWILSWTLLLGCAPKVYYLLSGEENYSDHPKVEIRLLGLARQSDGGTKITVEVANHSSDPLQIDGLDVHITDSNDETFPATPPPSGTIKIDESGPIVWQFNTQTSESSTFELQIEGLPFKVWPIIFSKEKPPDFKEMPEPNPGQGGPPRRPMPY